MKLITRNTDYALRALCFIAKKKNDIVAVGELVSVLKIPRPFLRKILQTLHKKGILNSCRGIGGGFNLARPASRISVTDVIEAFRGRLSLNECFFKKMACPNRHKCALKKKIDEIEEYIVQRLRSITIASLLR